MGVTRNDLGQMDKNENQASLATDHRAARSYWNIAAGLSMIHLTPCMVMSKLTVKER